MRPLDSLTGLRFFAAAYVVLYHRRVELSGYGELLDRVIANGFVGVPLFFVLSGFVLAYNYVAADGSFKGRASAFWIARVARIYPVYVLAFVLFAPAAFGTHAIPPGRWTSTAWSTLTLTQSWTELISWNRPGWTVSTEAFFYLGFPVLAPLVCRLRGPQLLWAAAIFWLVGIVAIVACGGLLPDEAWRRVLKHNPLVRLPEFLLGVALGKWLLDTRISARVLDWRACVGGALAGLAVAVTVRPTGVWYMLWHNGFLTPLFGLLICGLARGDATIVGMPGWRVLTRLGDASYGIYILQTPIHALCMGSLVLLMPGHAAARDLAATPLFVGAYALVLVAGACLSLSWYEVPARTALRRLARSSRLGLPVIENPAVVEAVPAPRVATGADQ